MKTKTIISVLLSALLLIGVSSCTTHVWIQKKPEKEKPLPPGQVKKITGSQSAAPYALGHNKGEKIVIQTAPAKKSKNKK